jgi:GPH family glycoside/pentoside/hexuronide:cation symporter
VFLTAALARFMEKKTMAIIGLVVIGFCQLGPVTLQMAGLVPPGGAMLVLGWAVILAGLGASAALIGFQSMMADAADEHEHLFYARREGLYFAGISFSVKASSGIGALIAGVALDLIGFTHALDEYKLHHVPIPPDTIRNLGITYGPGAALMTVVAVIILFSYRLGKAEHAAIREALDRRREGAS